MGVSFYVHPLEKVKGQGWFQQAGVIHPDTEKEGRYPTLNEMRAVVVSLVGYQVEENQTADYWQVSLDQTEVASISQDKGYAVLECLEYVGSDDVPQPFYFYRAAPETIITVTRELARFCGPFVVLAEYGECVVVTPETPPDAEWVDCTGQSDEDDGLAPGPEHGPV